MQLGVASYFFNIYINCASCNKELLFIFYLKYTPLQFIFDMNCTSCNKELQFIFYMNCTRCNRGVAVCVLYDLLEWTLLQQGVAIYILQELCEFQQGVAVYIFYIDSLYCNCCNKELQLLQNSR